MHSQTASQYLSSRPCYSVSPHRRCRRYRSEYGCRQVQPDFQQLRQFEPVGDRFQKLGIALKGAIALQPSNPKYLNPQMHPVLMPLQDQGEIRILLHRPFSQVKICVRSRGEVTLTALDHRGQCITQGCTREAIQTASSSAQFVPTVWLSVAANQLASLVLSAKVPFVIEAIQLTGS
ncbi:hypothetical protein [Almyronema epifaneia]|uniref:Uncharacterized protein n=1 Tax=Almyronema epifaneia S1 TaxID=2991925 RepID=A0ABW6ICF3_9CYAN